MQFIVNKKVVVCNECGKDDLTHAGTSARGRRRVQRYYCKSCGKYFAPLDEVEQEQVEKVR